MNKHEMYRLLENPGVKVYIVGGYVRDRLLGRKGKDHDFVVVGATPEMMISAGFSKVGADFPVFLNSIGDEYALARTERKVSEGYHGFETDYNPNITLEEDLLRRDLTINAMARQVIGWNDEGHAKLSDEVIDPYGGQMDLNYGILRHVSHHFREDPVRLLRTARFAARYNFDIAFETMTMLKDIVRHGEIDHLVPERVWQEIDRACSEPHVTNFFDTLHETGALEVLMPHIAEIYTIVKPDISDNRHWNSEQVFCIFGAYLPVEEICETVERLKVPSDLYQAVKVTSWCFPSIHYWDVYNHRDAEQAMRILEDCNASKSWQKSCDTGSAFILNTISRVGLSMRDTDFIVKVGILYQCFMRIKDVGFSDLTQDQRNTLKGKEISEAIRNIRVETIQTFLNRCCFQ